MKLRRQRQETSPEGKQEQPLRFVEIDRYLPGAYVFSGNNHGGIEIASITQYQARMPGFSLKTSGDFLEITFTFIDFILQYPLNGGLYRLLVVWG